ncbi:MULTISPECIES: hypothetical protein [unclassified Pseudomonas]|uniref:hypothetical protein n=1 Tax=unclassified Pseudomonas TaxID=196821 RepID=UPI0015A3A5F1|nr:MULTISPECIES: hypothetical protein [unclassified Pseudomonas]NWC94427.1 hypothetical protein [Pseudomonas sp. IPO3779]NWD18988.1 hypothetical protein [Pseudomonas sp. IPO3778]
MNAALAGTSINLTGNNLTFNNSGTIDPGLLGAVTSLSGGLILGNTGASTVNITNNGSIGSTALQNLTLFAADTPVVAMQGGSTINNGKLGLGYSGQVSRNDKDHAMTISFSLGF